MMLSEHEILGVDERGLRLMKLLMPETVRKRVAAYREKTRFVHYTSASAAAAIIGGRCVWLRNATTMNDVTEMQFGIDRVVQNFGRKSPTKTAEMFWKAIEAVDPSLPDKITGKYDDLLNSLRHDTYIFSLSEHRNSENELGRLSMWRAYGGTHGVAIVVSQAPFFGNSEALATYSYPVIYQDDEAAVAHFSEMAEQLAGAVDALRHWTVDHLAELIVGALQSYAICLKHPGFGEELEWRLAYQPKLQASDKMRGKLVEIQSCPQIIYELPLKDAPEHGLTGISPGALIERIIIGPTKYPLALYDYFVKLLSDAGIERAYEKVVLSHIPLRT
jgi:hypothetical protein